MIYIAKSLNKYKMRLKDSAELEEKANKISQFQRK